MNSVRKAINYTLLPDLLIITGFKRKTIDNVNWNVGYLDITKILDGHVWNVIYNIPDGHRLNKNDSNNMGDLTCEQVSSWAAYIMQKWRLLLSLSFQFISIMNKPHYFDIIGKREERDGVERSNTLVIYVWEAMKK